MILMPSVKTFLFRHRRLIISLLSLSVIYTLVGFYLLPWLAEKQLKSTLQQRLHLQAQVQEIHFNPYTFELSVTGLDIKTKENQPLAAWESVYINVDPSQLVKRNILIRNVDIDGVNLYFERDSDTENTLTKLATTWQETAPQQDAEPTSTEQAASEEGEALFNVVLDTLSFEEGQLHYVDNVPAETFKTELSPINFQLKNFSTKAGETAKTSLAIALEDKANLAIAGDFSLSPLSLSGQLTINQFNLQTPYRYFKAQLPVELKQGLVDIKLDYDLNLAGEQPKVDINNTTIQLSKLDVYQPGITKALITDGQLNVENGHYQYPENQLTIDNVVVSNAKLAALHSKQGEINWLQLIEALPKSDTEEAATSEDTPTFKLAITEVELKDVALSIEDQQPELASNMTLNVAASLNNLSLADNQKMPFTSRIKVGSGGELSADGELQLFPVLTVTADTKVDQLSLKPLQPYIHEYAYVSLQDGQISANASLKSNADDALLLKGDLALSSLQIDNQNLKEKLFSLEKLSVNTIDFSMKNKDLAISDIEVNKLYSRIFINQEGVTNLRMLLKEQPTKTTATTAETKAKDDPYKVSIGQVSIKDASSRFTDESLPIVFDTQMRSLDGEISGFSTQSDQAVELNLEGQVQEFGMVEIKGSLAPFNITEKSNVVLSFSNLDLPAMSPYTIKFAGRKIADGRADVKLNYAIQDGSLNATNSLVIRDIRLGERVESPNAVDLPLDLAVALLKNSDGVIDLSIPVTGDVNNPQFEMGPAIRKAIFNAIRNIVTSPFRFLANLIGGDEQPVTDIRFAAGRAELTPPQKEALLKLTEALAQRPQLTLEIPAPYAESIDRQQLQLKAVEEDIETGLKQTDAEQQLLERRKTVLERLYTEQAISPDLSVLKLEVMAKNTAADDQEPSIDLLAYNSKLKTALVAKKTVSEADLKQLAQARQEAVIAYIKQQAKLSDAQLYADAISVVKAKDEEVVMRFDLRSQ